MLWYLGKGRITKTLLDFRRRQMSQKTHRQIKITSPALIIEDIVLSLLVGWDDGDDGVLAVAAADTLTTRSSER